MTAQRLDFLFAILVTATGLTWLLGEEGAAGGAAAAVMLTVVALKGCIIVRDFMGLRHASLLWQGLLCGWLLVVIAIIGFAYRIS